MSNVIQLEPAQVKKCKNCDADIAFLKNKKGKWYVVNADYAVDGKPATTKTNFHKCANRMVVA
jgi:ssDNA-binding Zn-finger/Zn-ribbon topoisomerase 1